MIIMQREMHSDSFRRHDFDLCDFELCILFLFFYCNLVGGDTASVFWMRLDLCFSSSVAILTVILLLRC